jgi:hypothetical protein
MKKAAIYLGVGSQKQKGESSMDNLKMELIQLNEAIDMITMMLDKQEELGKEYDPQLVEQLRKRLDEREELIKTMESLN